MSTPLSAFLPEWLSEEILGAVSALDGQVEDLFPEELALIAKAITSRQIEFATGRLLARQLMAQLGSGPAALLRHSDHSPSWPSGVIGSIAHTKGACGVAIARTGGSVLGIGIDLELDAPLEDGPLKRVLTEREQRWLNSIPDPAQRQRRAMIAFSVKEAIYKCLHPVGNAGLGFRDVELEISSGTPGIVVRPGPGLARRMPKGATLECGFAFKSGLIHTAAVLRDDSSHFRPDA